MTGNTGTAAAPEPSLSAEFAGKVAVVTGGSAGIGRAIARAFAQRGAHVVLAGRNVAAVEKAAEDIARETRVSALAAQTDVAVPEQCERLIQQAVAHFGAVDVLVNNAAYFGVVPLLDAEPQTASRFLDTNLLGPLNCGRTLARWAIEAKRAATIVNVSSIAGARAVPGLALYCAS
ncbi:MAG: SDR family NAD(P)-dependent oxidoreductase, partial [Hyphomicrobiales bacterium]|nr:SDR family NAD(P)-dependent oxidoreductase [Hyphomicrobiales bacterium]